MEVEQAERVSRAVRVWHLHYRSHDCRLSCPEGAELWGDFEMHLAREKPFPPGWMVSETLARTGRFGI